MSRFWQFFGFQDKAILPLARNSIEAASQSSEHKVARCLEVEIRSVGNAKVATVMIESSVIREKSLALSQAIKGYESAMHAANARQLIYEDLLKRLLRECLTPHESQYEFALNKLLKSAEAYAHMKLLGAAEDSQLFKNCRNTMEVDKARLFALVYEQDLTQEQFEERIKKIEATE